MKWRASQSAEYLETVRSKAIRIKSLVIAIVEQRALAEGLSGIDYSKDKVKTSPTDAHMSNAVCKLYELIDDKQATVDAYQADIQAAYRAIDKMPSAECAAALEMHYIGGASWTHCGEVLGYTKQGMMRLRTRALSEFYEYIPAIKQVPIPEAI